MKTICSKQEKVHFAYFVEHDQLGIIAEHLTIFLFFLFFFAYTIYITLPITKDAIQLGEKNNTN